MQKSSINSLRVKYRLFTTRRHARSIHGVAACEFAFSAGARMAVRRLTSDNQGIANGVSSLKLTVVHHEFPYPPTHGGKADVWSRLVGLRRLGIRVQLVCWHEGPAPTDPHVDILRETTTELIRLTPRS